MAQQLVTIDLLTESGQRILTEDKTRHLIIHSKWVEINVSVGGGPYVANGFYIPNPKQITNATKMVLVSVKLGDTTWRRAYVVDRKKAIIMVRIVDLVNATRRRIQIGVDAVKKASKRVIASMKRQ